MEKEDNNFEENDEIKEVSSKKEEIKEETTQSIENNNEVQNKSSIQQLIDSLRSFWNKLDTTKRILIICGLIFIALLLTIPSFSNQFKFNSPIASSNNKSSDEQKDFSQFKWEDIVLRDIIPETESNEGKIKDNSESYLNLEVYNISESQYNEYVDLCKEKGFVVETKQISGSFSGYNQDGYEIELEYKINDSKMNIKLNAPMELGEIEWPDNKYAKVIPKPESMLGKIEKNSDSGFVVYIGNTSKEDLKNYIQKCKDQGFNVGISESETTFSAENQDSYNVEIEYKGNKVIKITMQERKFEVEIEIQCKENLLFSKYDVKVFIDKTYVSDGTIKHGTTEKYTQKLTEGSHYVKFENAEKSEVSGKIEFEVTKKENIKITIACTSDKINAAIGDNVPEGETEEQKNNETETKTNNIKVIDVKGQTLDKAKQKLKEAGFKNIKEKSDTGAGIWLESNWKVKEQSIEPGKEVSPDTEITLTCQREGGSLFDWGNDSNQEVIEVNYKTLYKEYDDNQIAADEKYKGKILKITGPIKEIDRELLGKPYITFEVDYWDEIQAVFKRSEESKISKLKKGQTVTIKGKCNGMSLGILELKDCEVVE